MARISTYSIDPVLNQLDKLHGSDENEVTRNFILGGGGTIGPGGPGGGTTNVFITNNTLTTKNNNLVNYITECDPRALAFLYHNDSYSNGFTNGSFQAGSININDSNASFPFSSVTTLKVSKFPFATALHNPSPNTAENILAEHVGMRIKWSWLLDPNIYGIYQCTAFVQDSNNSDHFDMALTYVSGNGSLTSLPLPDLYILEPFNEGDKHYTHTQQNASTTWTITHNLGKKPSVTAQLSNGYQFEADVEYININQCKLHLSAAESGTAYCN